MWHMFKAIRELPDTVAALVAALGRLIVALEGVEVHPHGDEALEGRLDALERSRAAWEGEMAGAMTRVEARFSAARAAEERARHMTRRLEENDSEGAAEGDEESLDALRAYVDAMGTRNGGGGGSEGVQPVRSGVASRAETREALRGKKFGFS